MRPPSLHKEGIVLLLLLVFDAVVDQHRVLQGPSPGSRQNNKLATSQAQSSSSAAATGVEPPSDLEAAPASTTNATVALSPLTNRSPPTDNSSVPCGTRDFPQTCLVPRPLQTQTPRPSLLSSLLSRHLLELLPPPPPPPTPPPVVITIAMVYDALDDFALAYRFSDGTDGRVPWQQLPRKLTEFLHEHHPRWGDFKWSVAIRDGPEGSPQPIWSGLGYRDSLAALMLAQRDLTPAEAIDVDLAASGGTVYYDFSGVRHKLPGLTGLYDLMVFFPRYEEFRFSDDTVEQFQFAWAAALGPMPKQGVPLSPGAVASALRSLGKGFVDAFENIQGWSRVFIPWLPSWHPKIRYSDKWEFKDLGKLRGFIIVPKLDDGVPVPGQIEFGLMTSAGHLCVVTLADGFNIFALPPIP